LVDAVSNNNLFLVNAPAGSGKTTTIKKEIDRLLLMDKDTSILCITYTNRAVKELIVGVDSENTHIKTIHSFISNFMKPFFSNEKIVELYFNTYESQIIEKIKKETQNDEYTGSAIRYVETYGKLDYETIKSNVKEISYNELEYNSLYYGGLGHNDLLMFSKLVVEKYPVLRKKISSRYKFVFIDEYQDTSANILSFFYEAIKGSNTRLYLFGDRMQQIYKNYDGSFEKEFKEFDTSLKLRTNYRSSNKIINLLNNIYNNKEFEQEPFKENSDGEAEKPKLIICREMENELENEIKSRPKALKLYIANKKRFNDIGVGSLFTTVSDMDKYKNGRKYKVVDVLTMDRSENPDALFRLLFTFNEICEKYLEKNYGAVIQLIKAKETYDKDAFFNVKILSIHFHEDKINLRKKIEKIVKFYNDESDKSILNYLTMMTDEEIIKREFVEQITDDEEYEQVLQVPFQEVLSLCRYLKDPHVSTQHGVKGEGHDEVFFIAEDNSHLSVKMYDFFELWTNIPVEFQTLQEFYYGFSSAICDLQRNIGIKCSSLRSADYKNNKAVINNTIDNIYQTFKENIYFRELYKASYEEFKGNDTLKNLKECYEISSISGIFNAYKLFYVGCSRAKKSLAVFVEDEKIKEYREKFIEKLKTVGFEVQDRCSSGCS
jgi:DNA helicase-2/ATP-dependent DNA helicase PcrA